MLWLLIFLLPLISAAIFYKIFLVPTKFVNFELKDRRSVVNAKRKAKVYSKDTPPPYPNGWFAIEQSINLKPGEANSIDCLGENFVVFRSKSNEVFVLDAYCPHMGAILGVGGNVSGDCIECPFHAWKFSGETGECVDIPYSENFDDVKKQAKVKKWISREVNGFIYVWYHAENEEPWDLPSFNLEALKLQHSSELVIHAHVQEIFDNINDVAHLKYVHGASVFAGKRPTKPKDSSLLSQVVTVKWMPDPKKYYKGFMETKYFFKFLDKYDVYTVNVDMFIYGPGIMIFVVKSAIGDMTFVYNNTPLNAFSYKASLQCYSGFWLGWFAKFSAANFLVNAARDQYILNSKKFVKNLLLVKEEKLMKESRIWYSRFYTPNSKTFEEAKSTLDW